jgi:hypothetical protein
MSRGKGYLFVVLIGLALVVNRFHRQATAHLAFWATLVAFCLFMTLPMALPIYDNLAALRHIQFS